jgi:hypothetical protein
VASSRTLLSDLAMTTTLSRINCISW